MTYYVSWQDYEGGPYLNEFPDKQSCAEWVNSMAQNRNEFEIRKIIRGVEVTFKPIKVVTEYEIG